MSCYKEPDSQIRDKVKVALNLSNYTTNKNYMVVQRLIHLI